MSGSVWPAHADKDDGMDYRHALICTLASADWRPGRVYFLRLLKPLAGTTGLWPLPPGRPVLATVGELSIAVDWFTASAAMKII